MIYLRLFMEFFKVGLFSVGGGLATLPFLADLGNRTGWFTSGQLADMVAVSESTPGPMGVNMAVYAGFQSGGVLGGVIAVLGLITPSVIVILIVAAFLQKFRQSRTVDSVFYGLRPASTALMTAAFLQVCSIALMTQTAEGISFHWGALILAAVIFLALREKHLKKLHPIFLIAASAVVGVLFQL